MTVAVTSRLTIASLLVLAPLAVPAWPLDGYPETGIRRVEGSRLANEGKVKDVKQPAGALLPTSAVDLRLLGHRDLDLPAPDADFTAQIVKLLGNEADRYGIAVLDLTDPDHPRYAEYRGDYQQNVGSVGKLVVATALFQALADTWPDAAKRLAVLKNTEITADAFAHWDHHTIRLFNPETDTLVRRPVQDGDRGSLYEWLDWMLSVSSNSAASMVMREAMLIRQFGTRYPVPDAEIEQFFRDTPKRELSALFDRTFVEPLKHNGFDVSMLRQGSFFTAEGKRLVPGVGNSYGTARELMKLVLRLEEGRVVDEWSSRQIKRLLYMTERRIRYASSPALSDAAVYFKSGSLYDCEPEPGFNCGPYRGNARNYMNSVAIVESPANDRKLHYAVTLISNVLRKNSAATHQAIATEIQKLLQEMHSAPRPAP
jgi:Beta-lactamase enzyme family